MADFYNPISDIQTEWGTTGGNHYGEIDDGVHNPGVPTLADYVSTNGNGAVDEWGFPIVAPTVELCAWVYVETGSNATIEVSLQQGGVERASLTVPVNTPKGWWHCCWMNPTGDLSTLTIEATMVKSGGGAGTYGYVYAAYLRAGPNLDVQVEANADDDYVRRSDTSWSDHASRFRAGRYDAANHSYGGSARFTGVDISAGATIDVAYLSLRSNVDKITTVVRTDLCCENSSNPGQMASYADHIGRARTADVEWDAIGAWVSGTWYDSPSIVAPVQTVVDDNGGTGSALIVFWEDKDNRSVGDGAWRQAYPHNDDPPSAPKLHIEYTTGGQTFYETVVGALTHIGNMTKKTETHRAGAIAFVGIYLRTMKFARSVLAGAIAFTGTAIGKTEKVLEGVLTSSGVVISKAKKALAGAFSSAGVVAKKATAYVAGTFTSAGVLVRNIKPAVITGAITFAGIVTKNAEKLYTGALTTSGILKGKAEKVLAGVLTSSGALVKKTKKVFVGAFASDGTLVGKAAKILAGGIVFVGTSLRTMKFARTILTGVLTTVGVVVKKANKVFTGASSFVGALRGKARKLLAGSLTPSGISVKKALKSLTGTSTFVGVLLSTRLFYKILAGAITFTGTLTRKTNKVLAGAVTLAGTISKLARKVLSGALTFIGRVTGTAPVRKTPLTLYVRSTYLTLNARSTDLTLDSRSTDLTLRVR